MYSPRGRLFCFLAPSIAFSTLSLLMLEYEDPFFATWRVPTELDFIYCMYSFYSKPVFLLSSRFGAIILIPVGCKLNSFDSWVKIVWLVSILIWLRFAAGLSFQGPSDLVPIVWLGVDMSPFDSISSNIVLSFCLRPELPCVEPCFSLLVFTGSFRGFVSTLNFLRPNMSLPLCCDSFLTFMLLLNFVILTGLASLDCCRGLLTVFGLS